MIKAIILDMDGLLIDSEPFWREAEIKVFTAAGVSLNEKLCLETIGLRTDEVVDYWFSRYPWKNPARSEVALQINRKVMQLLTERGRAKPGVQNIFSLIRQGGYKSAVASSSSAEIISTVMKKLNLFQKLDIMYSAEHEPYGKPHPGVYITAAKKLGVEPSACLAFEDSVNGLLAAKAAKMKCIAVPDAFERNRKEFCIADGRLNSLEEVTEEMIRTCLT